MTCTGLIDEAHVTVDTSLLERAAASSPLLAGGLVLALVGLGFAVRAAPAGHRAWSFLGLLAAPGAWFAWFWLALPTELTFPCVLEPAVTSRRLVTVSLGIAMFCFLLLCVLLSLRAWKRELKVAVPVVLLTTALIISGAVGLQKRALGRDFMSRVGAVMPVPNVIASEKPPEAHVGHSRVASPWVLAAGRTEGFFIPSRVTMTDEQKKRWGLESISLMAEREGLTTQPIHLVRDLVSVDAELTVLGVRDDGPKWFPLKKGNRWEFVAVRGRGGAVEKLQSLITRGKKALPPATLIFEVTGEGERDGFHTFELTETRGDAEPRVRELVRRNDELLAGYSRVSFSDGGGCRLNFLEPAFCTCLEDRINSCVSRSGDLGESLLRLFLGAVTLGATEILGGMGDLGAGNEVGLLMTQWEIDGTASSLVPPQRGKRSSKVVP